MMFENKRPSHSTSEWTGKQKTTRHIFHVRDLVHLGYHLREMKKDGIRPIRYLEHLGMMIGETGDSITESELKRYPGVEYSEQDLHVTLTEPYLHSVDQKKPDSLPWGIELVKAHKVWRYSRGRGIRVAVIDTGIAADHPAVRDNYRGGINILSPYFAPQDYNGHGTHVAGIIAGRSAELGIIGIAPRTHIYAVKAFNRRGSAQLSDLLSAINWCIENKMQIINMSFGMDKLSESLKQAIQIAHQRGIVTVAATGNQGLRSQIDYPARYPETIAVTSISKNRELSPFSNFGKGVDIAAPGDRIPSAWLNNGRKEMSGTSMAVPHVTGTIALLLYLNPHLNPEQIRYILKESCVETCHSGNVGILDAFEAVRLYTQFQIYFQKIV